MPARILGKTTKEMEQIIEDAGLYVPPKSFPGDRQEALEVLCWLALYIRANRLPTDEEEFSEYCITNGNQATRELYEMWGRLGPAQIIAGLSEMLTAMEGALLVDEETEIGVTPFVQSIIKMAATAFSKLNSDVSLLAIKNAVAQHVINAKFKIMACPQNDPLISLFQASGYLGRDKLSFFIRMTHDIADEYTIEFTNEYFTNWHKFTINYVENEADTNTCFNPEWVNWYIERMKAAYKKEKKEKNKK